MVDGLTCLIAIGESEQKNDKHLSSYILKTLNKGKTSSAADVSNALYLIAIDRRL